MVLFVVSRWTNYKVRIGLFWSSDYPNYSEIMWVVEVVLSNHPDIFFLFFFFFFRVNENQKNERLHEEMF